MIRFENVSKYYGNTRVLNKLNFEIAKGEFVVLIGPSGCGKTTTLRAINRLIDPNEGKIYINGEDTSFMDKVQMRRAIGYVIQQIGLFPNMTVEQNICVVPKLLKYDKDRQKQITRDMLALVNMPYEEFAHKYPTQMSGGQQQRVGVLRALAASPPIVLMDEPFGALDPMTRGVLQDEITRLQRKLGKTIVFVTHDMDEAFALADRIIFMDKGDIVQMATPEDMLANPAHQLIRDFMGRRGSVSGSTPDTAADIMRTDVRTTNIDRSILRALEIMSRRRIDTIVVVNKDETYAGTVSIEAIRNAGEDVKSIAPLVESCATSYVDENAQECFDKLFSSGEPYIVVLNRDNTVAGMVTKTSMAKALAKSVWGENS